jgi:hypothetical protein
MKHLHYLLLFITFLYYQPLSSQGFAQIGTPMVDNDGLRMIALSDGNYITVGLSGGKAAMHKTDCRGNILATLEKQVFPGSAVFSDVIELPDGNLVAVGNAIIATPTDTLNRVYLLKATPGLVEITSGHFLIQNKAAQGKSLVASNSGALMILGEVESSGADFTDIFVQAVDAATLEPVGSPSIYNNGFDISGRIIKSADGLFLLSGHSLFGDPFDPLQKVYNVLWLIKINEAGVVQWETEIPQLLENNIGIASIAGVRQSNASGNLMLAGTLYSGMPSMEMDGFYALISPDGIVLDTAYASAPGRQQFYSLLSHQDNPGLFTMVGGGVEIQPGVPTLALAQAYEFMNTIFVAAATVDVANPVLLRDILELDPGRFAYMGTLPDNAVNFSLTDIVIGTPAAIVGVVFQNCALAAVLNAPASAFQWYFEGQPIPNANQGVYFPTQPGIYALQVLDAKGCSGISDTFRVDKALAAFNFTATGLSVEFSNLSVDATQYQWNFGDGGTSVSINPTHNYAAGGIYNVTLIAKTSCSPAFADTITQQVLVMSSSAEEPEWAAQTKLFPNPTTGKLTMVTPFSENEPAELFLCNMVGQVVWREQVIGTFQTDIQELPSGVYTLSLRSGKALKVFQVVKQ